MAQFKETDEIGFDGDGFAMHAECGERLVEEWCIASTEEYYLKRDGKTVLASEGGDDKDCDGVWCPKCSVPVAMEKEAE